MKYLSLFSGIGGFEFGIQKAFRRKKQKAICVGFSEIDKHAIKIYERHFPKHKNFGDIKKIKATQLPDFDMLVGGFPCQAFSIAGKRKGFADTRGTLFFDIARILRAKKPRHCIFENVKGLLSHDDGRTFKTIISTLAKLGYRVEWQVCNSKDFGVAQNRERVYIVGHRGAKSGKRIFPLIPPDKKLTRTNQTHSRSGIHCIEGGKFVGNKIYGIGGISPTILTRKEDIPVVSINTRIRRLTPTECERLQGFPDGWTQGTIDSHRYKCLGNAVTTNVITAITKELFAN